MLTRRTLLSVTPAVPLALATTPAASTPQERIAFHAAGLREAMAEAAPEANSPWHFGIGKQATFQAVTGFLQFPARFLKSTTAMRARARLTKKGTYIRA